MRDRRVRDKIFFFFLLVHFRHKRSCLLINVKSITNNIEDNESFDCIITIIIMVIISMKMYALGNYSFSRCHRSTVQKMCGGVKSAEHLAA